MDQRRPLGKTGEDFALDHLRRRGFSLLDRNYRTRRGEIDLITVTGDTLVFVEVKTRVAQRPGMRLPPNSVEWITSRQQRRRRPLAVAWLRDRSHSRPRHAKNIRFDSIGVLLDPHGGLIDLTHVQEVA